LFESLSGRRFDVVAWNPPFFSGEPATMTERSFFGGGHLEAIARFASALPTYLSEDGVAYLIFSSDADIRAIRPMFLDNRLTFAVVREQRWGVGELFLVVEIRSMAPHER
jgi:methylase of polypeptide subunit release factors